MRWRAGGVALLLVASSAACSGKPDGCITLDKGVAQAVVSGATGDLRLQSSTGRAIRADTGVYFAAYRIAVAGSDGVGVWALDGINPPGAIRSVDGYAQEFTRWPVLDGGNGSSLANSAKACLD